MILSAQNETALASRADPRTGPGAPAASINKDIYTIPPNGGFVQGHGASNFGAIKYYVDAKSGVPVFWQGRFSIKERKIVIFFSFSIEIVTF
ncbi:MAG: hypothetical protein SOT57_05735 [Eubacteriales bacterium]|nr:hypothetical protein [Eubacteriales bacterium]